MQDTAPILKLDGLVKSFDLTQVLKGVSITIKKGEFITLLGPSGCGKTTTLRIIAGLETPDAGRVILNGVDVTDFEPNKRKVNTVFQNYALFPHMNVEKNIEYGLKILSIPAKERKARVDEMLDLVKLPGYGKRMPGQLSGGQRQRVAIARAVVLKPDVLLLDEPLGALDLQLRQQMQRELKALQVELNITFVYITHDQDEALGMSDRIAIMNDGQFEQIGTPETIYERPTTRFAAQFVGHALLFEGRGTFGRFDAQEGCQLYADDNHATKAGNLLSVHCERVNMTTKPVDGFDLPARVISHRYAGAAIATELALKTGRVIEITGTAAITDLPRVNEGIYLSWDPAHAALINEGSP